jgi:hypothetical protein
MAEANPKRVSTRTQRLGFRIVMVVPDATVFVPESLPGASKPPFFSIPIAPSSVQLGA